jgi:5-methylcytosine-specific restriction endonuclease McrBC GTP-binding regulatory subunit McrB
MTSVEEGLKQHTEFLKAWPIERLKSMTLDEYTNDKRSDAFIYWLEFKTNKIGGIKGRSSKKFGIYRRSNLETEVNYTGYESDGIYTWHKKYGAIKDKAFNTIKNIIIQIAENSQAKNFSKIDELDLGDAVKWKIAFLYNIENLLPIFKYKVLQRIAYDQGKSDAGESKISELQEFIISKKPSDISTSLFSEELWEKYKEDNFYSTLEMFLKQAKTDDLNTSHYPRLYNDLKVKVNFGQKNLAKIPWIAFTNKFNKTSKGIYPVYLYFKEENLLILSCGISETEKPDFNWNLEGSHQTITDYFSSKLNEKPYHYGDSIVYKVYDLNQGLDEDEVEKDLEEIINKYNSIDYRGKVNYWVFQGNPKIFNVIDAISDYALETWSVKAFKDQIKKGDKVILWVTGEQKGCYALCEVASDIYEGLDDEAEMKYYANRSLNEESSRVKIKITHNFSNNPITMDQISSNDRLSKLKVGNQGTNFSATQDEYNTILEMAEKMNKNIGSTDYNIVLPLNTIFYGPPGTGKTYKAILRAAQIIENRIITDYPEAQRIFKKNLRDRIEFITFHQNYSYEDFIQGLRPDVENEGNLSFERKDGVFKRISDRALNNLKLSEKQPEEVSRELKFDVALDKFIDEIQEKEDNYKINDAVYISEVEEDAFRYTGYQWRTQTGSLRMKFKDLREFYLNNVANRRDIKQLKSVSPLSIQHATYYFNVYQKILSLIPNEIETPNKVQKQNYVIIIDEINRANISRVFGELITLIEPDKRSNGSVPLICTLPSGEEFIVPSNLYIIGTMNTADKSIALLDIALRRRFEFEEMYPQYEIEGHEIYDVEILKKINKRIRELKGHDFQIGHSYFMDDNIDLIKRMNNKVIPLLLEYFMNDEKEVKGILLSAGLSIEEDSWPIKINGII